MSKIKCVVFDADGVVVDRDAIFSHQLERDYGISSSEMLHFFHGVFQDCLVGKKDLKEVLPELLEHHKWKGSLKDFMDYWFKSEDFTDKRVLKTVGILRKNGIKCFVGTNQEIYRTNYMKKNMNFDKLFDEVYSSAIIGAKKPQEEFFREVTKRISNFYPEIRPEEILFFDDSIKHVEGAKQFGWEAYLYEDFEGFRKIINKYFNF